MKGLYVDCVRRMEVSSAAKVFVLDDLLYETSAADDGICGRAATDEGGGDRAGEDRARHAQRIATSCAHCAGHGRLLATHNCDSDLRD